MCEGLHFKVYGTFLLFETVTGTFQDHVFQNKTLTESTSQKVTFHLLLVNKESCHLQDVPNNLIVSKATSCLAVLSDLWALKTSYN